MANSEPIPLPSPQRPPKKRKLKRFHTRLHRWLGMWSLAIVLVIAVTGVILNHTAGLELDQRRVTWSPLLKYYGMEPAGEPSVFLAGDRLLATWDGQILLDGLVVDFAPESGELVGAGTVDGGRHVYVFPDLVLAVEANGQIFDRLDAASLPPSPIRRAGSREDRLILETDDGARFVLVDWLEAKPAPGAEPAWFTPAGSISGDQRERLAEAFRAEGLALSRILLDVHSGRILGPVGVLLYDLAAVSLVILGITGTMLWFRRR